MAIRAFLITWSEEQQGNLIQIVEPIDEYLSNISLSAPVNARNFYAKRSQVNGRPDKVFLLKVMDGEITDQEWSTLAALPDVNMIPPNHLDKALSTLSKPLENQIKKLMGDYSIPLDIYNNSPTIGALLRNVLAYVNDSYAGFGDLEERPADWA